MQLRNVTNTRLLNSLKFLKRICAYRTVYITNAGPGPVIFTIDRNRPFGVITAALKTDVNRTQFDGYNIEYSVKELYICVKIKKRETNSGKILMKMF